MRLSKTFEMPFRRRREEKTNFKKRLALLKGGLARLVVRKSLNNMVVQVMDYNIGGDALVAAAHSTELKEFGWKMHKGNIPAAYLTGMLCAKKSVKAGVKEAVLDIGLTTPVRGSKIFAALKGAVDAGMEIKHGEEVLPGEDRISGKHIGEYAAKLSKEELEKKFSNYVKAGIDPAKAGEHFEEVKSAIKKKYGDSK